MVKQLLKSPKRQTAARLVTVSLFVILPMILRSPFSLHILIMFCVYAVLGEAWNILGGYAGQVSLGHTVFFGIGAYSSTLLSLKMDWSPWIGMLIGMVIAAAIAVAIGYPTFRLSGKYFVIASIAILQISQTMVTGTQSMGGAAGLSVPFKDESFLHMQFHSSKIPYAYISIVMLAIAVFLVYRLDRSRVGYYLRVIRENEDVAESLGIDTVAYKLYAIILSAVLTSAAGTFYAQYVLFIDPNSVISYPMAIKMSLLTVLGGAGTVLGPVAGALILIPLSELSRAFFGGGGRGVDLIIYGLLITIMAIYRPDGIAGIMARRRAMPGGKGGTGIGQDA